VSEPLECLGPELYDLGKELVDSDVSLRMEVHGWSMYPWIRRGDVIEIAPVLPDEIDVGDVVFFRSGDRLLAHRVVGFMANEQGVSIRARGDSFLQEDPPFTDRDLIGKVEIVYRPWRDRQRAIRLDQGLHGTVGLLIARSRVVHCCLRMTTRTVRRCAGLVKVWIQ
jgi:signal peptidase I